MTLTTETPDQRRARLEARYDHTHTPAGAFIYLNTTQDAAAPACLTCSIRGAAEPWQHQIRCATYQPHPGSIAATTPTEQTS